MISSKNIDHIIYGERQHGADVRNQNLTAVLSISNILKSSLGPHGLDKMLVDDIGEVTVTNDGATILQLLEVKHPAAQVLVDLSKLQDDEVGDGTTSVVLLAAELLKRGTALITNGLHASNVISGYKLAMRECVKYINECLKVEIDDIYSCCINVSNTVLSSKLAGIDSNFFSNLVYQAITRVKLIDSLTGDIKYPVKSINILKSHGKSLLESELVNGYALSYISRASQQMPKSINNAKIACIDFSLKQYRMQLGIKMEITDPSELKLLRMKEKDIVQKRVQKIIDSGCNVLVTSGGIDDQCIKYFVSNNCIAIKSVDKKDLRRIAKVTGSKICISPSDLDDDDCVYNKEYLGECDLVKEVRIGDVDFMLFTGCKLQSCCTIILRGANDVMLDELERSLNDTLCSLSKVLETNKLVSGGGSVETALNIYLEDFARTLGSREQLAIAEYAEALLIIPKILCINSANDSIDLVSKLRAVHAIYQNRSKSSSGDTSNIVDGKLSIDSTNDLRLSVESKSSSNTEEKIPEKNDLMLSTNDDNSNNYDNYRYYGLDLVNGIVRNNSTAGVLEPMINKIKALRFATEAAVTLLRIDDYIKVKVDRQQNVNE